MHTMKALGWEAGCVKKGGLNLKALRERVQRAAPEEGAPGQQRKGISRRQLLQVAGAVTAVGALVRAGGAKAATKLGAASLVTGPGRAAFWLDGQERWVIDTKRFGGRPRLTVDATPEGTKLQLTGAYFPGTEIPAGLTCTVTKSRMRLELEFGQFVCDLSLERWLAGLERARAPVSLGGPATKLGAAALLLLSGRARAEFSPDWTLRVDGRQIATLNGLPSDQFTLRLPTTLEPSLLHSPPARRTALTLERGAHPWQLSPVLPAGWSLSGAPWTRLQGEAALSARGEARHAILAEAPGQAELKAGPIILPITKATLALTGDHQALVARYAEAPTWIHQGGVSLLVGDGPQVEPLAITARGGALERVHVAPALLGVNAPLDGALTEATWNPEGSRLVIAANEEQPPLKEFPVTIIDGQINLPPRQTEIEPPPVVALPSNLQISVIRPEDMLVLRFEFVGLTLQTGGDKPARLVRKSPQAYIIAHFPPQHIAEQAFFEAIKASDSETPAEPPVQARMAGPSRLVFKVPAAVTEIPYTLEELLSWIKHEQSVSPVALPPPVSVGEILKEEEDCGCAPVTPGLRWPPPKVTAPEQYHTAIEAPYRVILSTNKHAAWAHAVAPVTQGGAWTELWHTRLGVKGNHGTVDEQSATLRTVRAIWSPDYTEANPPPTNDTSPFRMSLKSRNRNEIVHMSSDFTIGGFTPLPIKVDRLMLSSLGAWMNVAGQWEPPGAYNLEEWRHRAVMGRDTYVRVVEKGYLFPLGHRASLITITERKFQSTPSGKMAAYLRQREYIVVRQFEKTYPGTGMSYAGRAFPFTRVQLTTLLTPDLDPAQNIPGTPSGSCRWVRAGGEDFLFHCVSEDRDGNRHEFTMPLVFVLNSIADNDSALTAVRNHLRTTTASRRQRPMGGQKIAYAPSDKPGDTAFETQTFTFDAEVPDSAIALPANQPRFYPAMGGATVRMAAVEQVTGAASGAAIKYHQTYLEKGFSPAGNKASVWAELDTPVKMLWKADQAGGVSTPNLEIGGISRKLGPVGGSPDDLMGSTFDPKKFFSNEAKILGGILLTDILDAFGLDELGGDGKKAPKLTNRVVYPGDDKSKPPEGLETRFLWEPKVVSDPLKVFEASANTTMKLDAKMLTKFAAPPTSTYEILGELKSFKGNLIGDGPTKFLVLTFKQLVFTAKSGEKADVKPEITAVDFAGPLKFINNLKDFLKSTGNGPSIDVSPTGVMVGFSLAIPNVMVGVLSIQNMKLTSSLSLPFGGDPVRLRFAFCEREHPFLLTVSMFGGGGFFGINLGLDGVELLEASFEFGGQLALDIGVASGGVYVMAGIYFKMEGDDCTLTGYLKLGGSLCVLGIITISAEFYMALTYQSAGNKVYGQATLTVKVEILFFSASVDMTVEKRFKGDDADPLFADLIDQPHWDEYCEAFA